MKARADTGHELTRVGLFGFLAPLRAKGQVVLHRFSEGAPQLSDTCTLEGDDIARVDDFAVKDAGLVVEFNPSDISFVFHHGVTPASVRNRRRERRAPLSVSLRGCGR